MRLRRRGIAWGSAGVAAAAFLVYTLRPTSLSVDTATAAHGPLRVTIDDEGRTRVRDRYVVMAPVAGRVSRITLEEGSPVAPGTVVAELSAAPLDPRGRLEAAARLRAAEDAQRASVAAVTEARAALAQARRNRVRAESLFSMNALSVDQREQAALAETTAVQRVEAAEFRSQAAAHDVEQARATVSTTRATGVLRLRAPVRGRVLRIPEQSERVVAAGTPLLELGDPNRLEIVIDLLSEDAVKVQPGDRIIVDDWGGDHALEGHVRRVEPAGFTKVSALGIEEQRVNVVADLDETPPQLGDGYRVEARVVLWESASVLKVPGSALFQDGDGWAVFLVRDGRARRHVVQVGHRNALEVEITGGLSAGDAIVLHPTDKLADGVRVAARAR
ncbi:MAG TPA: efflux RND transporter periplasmic adaptor subunit [Gemmatimonadales bacterium]|nr:efflux RND transporter periplasmic adaptor subunit [Gemmatimonadales bacterium]